MSTTLRFLGGASEVGRIGAVLEGDNGSLLLDYGLQPDDPPKFPLPAPEVDALLLTHAHLDHCGLVPKIASRGTPVVSTPVTGDLAERMAQDTLRVAEIENYPIPFHKSAISDLVQNHRSILPGNVEYRGGFEFNVYNAGHIPGAINFPYTQAIDSLGRLKKPEDLKKLLADYLEDKKDVIGMCGSGVTACHVALTANLAGFDDIGIYIGSWSQWIVTKDISAPIGNGSKSISIET